MLSSKYCQFWAQGMLYMFVVWEAADKRERLSEGCDTYRMSYQQPSTFMRPFRQTLRKYNNMFYTTVSLLSCSKGCNRLETVGNCKKRQQKQLIFNFSFHNSTIPSAGRNSGEREKNCPSTTAAEADWRPKPKSKEEKLPRIERM